MGRLWNLQCHDNTGKGEHQYWKQTTVIELHVLIRQNIDNA